MSAFSHILGQTQAIESLRRAYLADRLPHALLFAGPIGVGKQTTATALAKLFLCEKAVGDVACTSCDSCRLVDAGNHPDVHVVYRQLMRLEKEKAKARDLTVDVIRDFLIAPANLKTNLGRGKFFLVEEAELMNATAQNALLKTLEEPFGRTLIVLLTDQPLALLSTIRSRSQMVRFGPISKDVITGMLRARGADARDASDAARLAGGSLGLAIKWLADGVVSAARELADQLDGIVQGNSATHLPDWLSHHSNAYAEKQLEIDELASKDQASKEGLAVYLRVASEHLREMLTKNADAAALDAVCGAVEALARAETLVDANVTVSLVFQQLAVALEREFATEGI